MSDARRTTLGVACGAAAGALWGLVFVAPEVVRPFGPLQLSAGRYLTYGIFALALLAPRWRQVTALLGRREWLALCWLSLLGNSLYYVLLATGVQLGGVATPSLVIGFLPVAVTIIGSRDKGAVPLRKLAPSLLLSGAGVICIGWEALGQVRGADFSRQALGLLCAFGALASWTTFAVSNSRWMARLPQVSAHDWSLLIGVVTGVQALVLVPPALLFDTTPHAAGDWLFLLAVSSGIAVFSSIIGNGLWNRMSRLLPLTMVGQMILFETLFALLYGFFWDRRLPTQFESLAIILVLASVTTCLAAHRKPSAVGEAVAAARD
ncbi:EamA family transporter [Caulobacter radicis]|uniref:DMT family transporter n=1 Tax=Caulobacter radicis TaxID=2172650 RepID=UPI000D57D4A8|nr:DMT family transporter [Caulobacter radicis]PVM84031.1 EamA family transporter [Caulobacter radicis]